MGSSQSPCSAVRRRPSARNGSPPNWLPAVCGKRPPAATGLSTSTRSSPRKRTSFGFGKNALRRGAGAASGAPKSAPPSSPRKQAVKQVLRQLFNQRLNQLLNQTAYQNPTPYPY